MSPDGMITMICNGEEYIYPNPCKICKFLSFAPKKLQDAKTTQRDAIIQYLGKKNTSTCTIQFKKKKGYSAFLPHANKTSFIG